jgi:F-type H+-transporting ATPase subunit a
MFYSPLEQFENHLLYPIKLFGFDFSITTYTLALLFSFIFFCLLFLLNLSRVYLIPTQTQLILEDFYLFIVGMVRSQTGFSGFAYIPLVFTVFSFIFCCNFLGLIPFSFTSTAQIFLPFFISISLNFGLIIIGFFKHKLTFFRLFIPSGISMLLVPLVFVIELSTYLLRPFSLALRLFANMMAGHTLLFICTITLYIGLVSSAFVFATGFFLVFAVFSLELLISFLQAYVFSVLFCVYLNDSLHPVH